MKVSDLITELGDVLQEDFVTAPLWTKEQLHGYIRQALKEFSTKTLLIDRSRICLVDGSTGEFTAPGNFHSAYYLQFNKAMVDLVQYSDLEFASETWSLGATATTPLAATVYGSGANAVVRMVPTPSTATGAFAAGTLTSVRLADSGGTVWTVTVAGRRLVTTVAGASGMTVLLGSGGTIWRLGVSTSGQLTTTLSAGSGNTIYLTDSSDGLAVLLAVDDEGELVTSLADVYGVVTKLDLDGVLQNIKAGANSGNANYGVLVDLYATGVSTTPECTARLNSPVGEVSVTRSSDYAADMWYKATIEDVPTMESEIYLSKPFLAVLKHGILALAFAHDGDGRDLIKAKVLRSLFESECEAIKRTFNRQ